jgi:hypothetical protein
LRRAWRHFAKSRACCCRSWSSSWKARCSSGPTNFNAWERLLTEAKILWIYVYKAVLGMPAKLGIYQQPPEVLRNPFGAAALMSWLSWLALLIAAISWRRRFPLAAFAVLWFFAGHLIESTVVPLELYFEHRNYLPIIGPVFAISSALLLGSSVLRRAAVILPVTGRCSTLIRCVP